MSYFKIQKGPRDPDPPFPTPMATTLRTATLALVHSTADYCAPVWCRSTHTRLIEPAINDALRIVMGHLRPTPVENLPILAGIQPAKLRRKAATLSLTPCHGHLLQSAFTCPPSRFARYLKSGHPFVPGRVSSNINNFYYSDNRYIRVFVF